MPYIIFIEAKLTINRLFRSTLMPSSGFGGMVMNWCHCCEFNPITRMNALIYIPFIQCVAVLWRPRELNFFKLQPGVIDPSRGGVLTLPGVHHHPRLALFSHYIHIPTMFD